jgi:hypothetical protein
MPATFMITLSSTADEQTAIHALRHFLKRALRDGRLRCTDAKQIHPASGESS